MVRSGMAALCVAIPVILPGFAQAQEAGAPYNAPPNGVLAAAPRDESTDARVPRNGAKRPAGDAQTRSAGVPRSGELERAIVRTYERAAMVTMKRRGRQPLVPDAKHRARHKRRNEARASAKPAHAVPAVTARTAPQPQIAAKPASGSIGLSTRPDPLDRPQESPASTLRDAWKLLAYLAPVLFLVLLAIRGLKAFYTKQGRLPSVAGGFTLWSARKTGGSSIRVLESVPVGTVGLHLVEVRGKLLLLGTSGSAVNVLAEVDAGSGSGEPGFDAVLKEAREDLALHGDDAFSAVVHEIDGDLRQAKEAVLESAARMQGWQPGTN